MGEAERVLPDSYQPTLLKLYWLASAEATADLAEVVPVPDNGRWLLVWA